MKNTFKVTFLPLNQTVDVSSSGTSQGGKGEDGSILDIALGAAHVDIEHSCGGFNACATCHVYVEKGLETCNPASDQELDMLDNAPDTNLTSRLACQCVPNGKSDIIVRLPSWNRNQVKENKH